MGEADHIRTVRDAYARRDASDDRYRMDNPEVLDEVRGREKAWERLLSTLHHNPGVLLEIGAGTGAVLPWCSKVADVVVGVDLLIERLMPAKSRGGRVACADGAALPFPSGSATTVVLSTVLSSVVDREVREAIASEVDRVTASDGMVLFYDMRLPNPRNRDVRPITRRELGRLFPGWVLHGGALTLMPPIARRLRPHGDLRARLGALRPLRSHLALALVRR